MKPPLSPVRCMLPTAGERLRPRHVKDVLPTTLVPAICINLRKVRDLVSSLSNESNVYFYGIKSDSPVHENSFRYQNALRLQAPPKSFPYNCSNPGGWYLSGMSSGLAHRRFQVSLDHSICEHLLMERRTSDSPDPSVSPV